MTLSAELAQLWKVKTQHVPEMIAAAEDARSRLAASTGNSDAAFNDPMFDATEANWNIVRDNFTAVLAASVSRLELLSEAVHLIVRDYADSDADLAAELYRKLADFGPLGRRGISEGSR